jgi:hypothetical protein
MHNLDTDIQESFEFQVKGFKYSFRQPNTEEMQLFAKLNSKDEEATSAFIYQFITPLEESPAFEEVAKTMLIAHWHKFREMLEAELGAK